MSNDYNKITLIGRLTRDIDLKYTTTGTAIAVVSLASNRSVKKQDNWETEVSYFDANIYGRMAENLKPYLIKGKMILISGRLKQDRWEKDGQKFSRIKIEVEEVQLLGGNSSESLNNSNERVQPQFSAIPQIQTIPQQAEPVTPAPDPSLFNNDDFLDDIPF